MDSGPAITLELIEQALKKGSIPIGGLEGLVKKHRRPAKRKEQKTNLELPDDVQLDIFCRKAFLLKSMTAKNNPEINSDPGGVLDVAMVDFTVCADMRSVFLPDLARRLSVRGFDAMGLREAVFFFERPRIFRATFFHHGVVFPGTTLTDTRGQCFYPYLRFSAKNLVMDYARIGDHGYMLVVALRPGAAS